MKTNKKLILTLSFLTVLPTAFSLFSCDNNKNDGSSSNNISVTDNIVIKNPFKAVYGVGVIIDFDEINFVIERNGETFTISGSDNRLSISGGETDTVGKHQIKVVYAEKTFIFDYEVKQFYLTLDFNNGLYNEKSSVKVPLFNDRVDIQEYVPIYQEEELTKIFSGWFFDKECTERALFAKEKEFRSSDDITLYAGYDEYRDDEFTYTIDEKTNTATLTSLNFDEAGFSLLFDTKFVIPSTIRGYPVTEIGPNFFVRKTIDEEGNEFEEDYATYMFADEIVFNEDSKLEKIGDRAFANLSSLTKITFPESLQVIGNGAFEATSLSGELHFNKNLTKIGNSAFAYNVNLTSVTFEEGSKIKIIGENAFLSDDIISSVEFPEGLEEIRDEAFSGCNDITSVNLPSSISIIGSGAFKNMTSLQSINVSENNKNYATLNGNLYSRDMKKLIRYCYKDNETSFIVPSSVTSISDSAFALFSDYVALNTLTLNEGLVSIGKEAFNNCIFDVTLPKSVTGFSVETFKGYAGKKIGVEEGNEKYVAKDGIIYSKDYSVLYACPDSYEKTFFTLDDRVERISRNAFYGCTDISAFTIGENSSLKEVEKDALNLSSMDSLKYIEIAKIGNIKFALNSLSSKETFSNTFFAIVLASEDDKEKLVNQLDQNDSIINNIYLKKDVEKATLDAVETVFELPYSSFETSYHDFTKLPNILKDQVKTSLSLLTYSFNNNVYNDKEYLYYACYCEMLSLSMYNDIFLSDNYSVSNNGFALSYLNAAYKTWPSEVQTKVDSALSKCNGKYVYLNNEEGLAELYRDIISFNATSTSFDQEEFASLKRRGESLQIDNAIVPATVYEKYTLLNIDNTIADLLKVDLDSCDNAKLDELYIQMRGCSENNFYGLAEALLSYNKSEYRKSKVYRYDEYTKFAEKFEQLWAEAEEETVERIKNFDLTTFDSTEYINFYNNNIYFLFNRFYYSSYAFDDEIQTIDAVIYTSVLVDDLHEFDDGITDGNFASAYYFVKRIDDGLDSLSVDDQNKIHDYSYYLTMKTKIENYGKEYAETFADIISSFEIVEDNLSLGNIEELYDEYSYFIARTNTGSFDYASDFLESDIVAKYHAIVASYLINEVLGAYPIVTSENYLEVKKILDGFYSFDDLTKHDGYSSYINSYLAGADTSLVLNYAKYQEFLETLTNLESNQ